MTLVRPVSPTAPWAVPYSESDVAPEPSPRRRLRVQSVAALETRYRRELFVEILPFLDRHAFDLRSGACLLPIDRHGRPLAPEVSLAMQGQAIFLYSRLYRRHGASPEWRETADRAVAFVLGSMRGDDGSWMSHLARDGQRPARPTDDVLSNLHLAEGLAEYAHAVGDDSCRRLARTLAFETPGSETPAGTDQNPLLVATMRARVGARLLSSQPDPPIEQLTESSIRAIVEDHYNPRTGLTEEQSLSAASPPATTNFGASFAALGVAMRRARDRDGELAARCATRIRRHVETGWDRLFGGLVHAVRVDDGGYIWPSERPAGSDVEFRFVGEYNYMKSFRTLAAMMTAVLEVLQWRSERWAIDAFRGAQHVLDRHFSFRALGYPFYAMCASRAMTWSAHSAAPDIAHHPRLLVSSVEAFARLRAAGRRVL